MESPDHTNINLFQQIGQIQGTLAAQNTSNIAAFVAVTATINEFKNEFRMRTTEQDKSIENLRQEVNGEIEDLRKEVVDLKKFKDNYDGAKDEARKTARNTGGISGAVIGGLVTGLLSLINYVVHK